MDLCRDTSIILKTEAPLAAADVKNPDRREWAENFLASRPTRPASFDNVCYGSAAQALSRNFARSADRAKNRPFNNTGDLQPREQRLRRAIAAAPGYGHNHSLSLLNGLGARYPDQ